MAGRGQVEDIEAGFEGTAMADAAIVAGAEEALSGGNGNDILAGDSGQDDVANFRNNEDLEQLGADALIEELMMRAREFEALAQHAGDPYLEADMRQAIADLRGAAGALQAAVSSGNSHVISITSSNAVNLMGKGTMNPDSPMYGGVAGGTGESDADKAYKQRAFYRQTLAAVGDDMFERGYSKQSIDTTLDTIAHNDNYGLNPNNAQEAAQLMAIAEAGIEIAEAGGDAQLASEAMAAVSDEVESVLEAKDSAAETELHAMPNSSEHAEDLDVAGETRFEEQFLDGTKKGLNKKELSESLGRYAREEANRQLDVLKASDDHRPGLVAYANSIRKSVDQLTVEDFTPSDGRSIEEELSGLNDLIEKAGESVDPALLARREVILNLAAIDTNMDRIENTMNLGDELAAGDPALQRQYNEMLMTLASDEIKWKDKKDALQEFLEETSHIAQEKGIVVDIDGTIKAIESMGIDKVEEALKANAYDKAVAAGDQRTLSDFEDPAITEARASTDAQIEKNATARRDLNAVEPVSIAAANRYMEGRRVASEAGVEEEYVALAGAVYQKQTEIKTGDAWFATTMAMKALVEVETASLGDEAKAQLTAFVEMEPVGQGLTFTTAPGDELAMEDGVEVRKLTTTEEQMQETKILLQQIRVDRAREQAAIAFEANPLGASSETIEQAGEYYYDKRTTELKAAGEQGANVTNMANDYADYRIAQTLKAAEIKQEVAIREATDAYIAEGKDQAMALLLAQKKVSGEAVEEAYRAANEVHDLPPMTEIPPAQNPMDKAMAAVTEAGIGPIGGNSVYDVPSSVLAATLHDGGANKSTPTPAAGEGSLDAAKASGGWPPGVAEAAAEAAAPVAGTAEVADVAKAPEVPPAVDAEVAAEALKKKGVTEPTPY